MLRRVIHTSADFEYVQSLDCSDGVVEKGVVVVKCRAGIVTGIIMALSGINKSRLAPFGCRVSCHIADHDVAGLARLQGITCSVAACARLPPMRLTISSRWATSDYSVPVFAACP